MNALKILVVEDKEMHRNSAQETLEGHELTIVSSFDEAMDILGKQVHWKKVYEALGRSTWSRSVNMDEEFRDKEKELVAEIPDFDVVLTDMKMPMSKQTLGQGIFQHGVEVPYGFPIVLKAAKAGAKFVAMVTDTNHHQGAMSAAIDHIGGTFTIEGAEVLFVHARFVEDIIPDVDCTECTDGVCPRCNGSLKVMNWENELVTCRCTENNPGKCGKCKGTGKFDDSVWERKDWGEVLNRLIGK